MRTITQLLGAPQNEETNRQLEEILQFGIALANVRYANFLLFFHMQNVCDGLVNLRIATAEFIFSIYSCHHGN